jgi:hypothetical protein
VHGVLIYAIWRLWFKKGVHIHANIHTYIHAYIHATARRLWFKQDVDFEGKNWQTKPKLSLLFQITTPVASRTPRYALYVYLNASMCVCVCVCVLASGSRSRHLICSLESIFSNTGRGFYESESQSGSESVNF